VFPPVLLILPALPVGAALWSGGRLSGASLEAIDIAVTIALVWGVARSLDELQRSAERGASDTWDGFSEVLYRSVLRARRYGRTISLLAIEPGGSPADREVTSADVAALLLQATRDFDLVAERDGCLFAAFPEIGAAEREPLIARLESLVHEQLGLELRFGSACFPEDAITSEALIDHALADLDHARQASAGPEAVEILSGDSFGRVDVADVLARESGGATVAYVLSRFPKLTETFVLNEILAVERAGIAVSLHPLRREWAKVQHPEAVALTERAKFSPLLSWAIVRSNLSALRTRPRAWLTTLATLLRTNFGSLRYLAGAVAFFPQAVRLALQLERAGTRHVHAHFASHPAMVAFVVRRLAGIPYSFTAHGSDLHRDRHMLREKVREAAFVISISEYNRGVILDTCGDEARERVVVIHCGVDSTFFRPPAPPEIEDLDGAPRLICVGSLHAVKGQVHLVEACRILQERGLAFECDLIGGGADRGALEAQVQAAGLSDRVHFLGQVPRSEVAERLRSAALAVAPSVPTSDGRREGIPVALMEACASALPVVASRLSGIPELVEDGRTGFLVEPGDVLGLADAIERLLRSPELRRELGSAGRRKVEKEFQLDANAAALASRFTTNNR
jgi:glycosyltransferase involved in cell wall biosynthesis